MTKAFRTYLFVFAALFSLASRATSQESSEDIVIGKTIKIKSNILNEERTLLLYIPESYHTSNSKYPVLYLLDGRFHFLYTSGIVQLNSQRKHMPEMLIVGITNTNRIRDLTPTNSKSIIGEPLPESGGAEVFLQFLRSELLPYIDKNYRTQPYRVIAGHSLAGLFVIHSLLESPDLFDAYIASSPSLHWDNKFIMNQAVSVLSKGFRKRKSLFVSVGDKEGDQRLLKMKEFAAILDKKSTTNFEWKKNIISGADHGTAPYSSFFNALVSFFDGWYYDPEKKGRELQIIINHYKELTERFGFEIKAPDGLLYFLAVRALNENEIDNAIQLIRYMKMDERHINNMGYEKLGQNKMGAAIALFKLNVEMYPNSSNAYDSLGEAFMKQGEKELAIKNYKKSLELNPKNINAVEMLKKLERN